jgi:hypothetical protein
MPGDLPYLLDIDGGPDVTPDFDMDPADRWLMDKNNETNPDYQPTVYAGYREEEETGEDEQTA